MPYVVMMSLSKVFGAIDRFSEDLDLSVSPDFLHLPQAGTSRNQADAKRPQPLR